MNEHDAIVSISKDYIAIGMTKPGCIAEYPAVLAM